ncbi:hypothetical protein [Sporosarcina sp. Te-1]|uniref:hypothetical protein n=1 Tax=Sporosarcina sp. Te-1 TaxID=2818390 RepID=UPI001A9EC593|nr:hypothetical protein [Sporosarcina sp. Te-1]QTD41793.1 hypothetical protein J3U78_02765 [Sporosarcina sp. Te-1]
MIRLIWGAIVMGIVLGISIGFAINGWDVEGIMAGLLSILILVGISSFFYGKYRKSLQESHS